MTKGAGLLRDYLRDESGATAVEYGLIAGGIAIVIAAAVTGLGKEVKSDFKSIKKALK